MDTYKVRTWAEVTKAQANNTLNPQLLAKAREHIVDELAAVLAYERLQEVIPQRRQGIDDEADQLTRDERAFEARRRRAKELEAEKERLYDEWQELEAVRRRSNEANKAAYEAEQAYRQARDVHHAEESNLEDQAMRLRQRRNGLPAALVNAERLKKVKRPETPNLDLVLKALGLT